MKTQTLTLALGAVLLAGCASPSQERIPLSPGKLAEVTARSRSAEELDVTVNTDTKGGVQLGNTHNLPLGIAGLVRLDMQTDGEAVVPLVKVAINEHPALAVVNSGSTDSLIEYDQALQAQLTPLTYTRLDADGNPVAELLHHHAGSPGGLLYQFTSIARSLTLGDVKMYNVPFGVLNDERGFKSLWWLDGHSGKVVIGHDLLSSFDHATINYEHGTLRVGSGKYRPEAHRLVAAVPMVSRAGVPAVEATVNGQGPILIALHTAADFGLWIPYGLAHDLRLKDPAAGELHALPASTPWRDALQTLQPQVVNISGFEVPDVPAVVGLLDLGKEEPPYAVMGSRVLKNYSTTFDYKAGKVYFEQP